RALAQLGLTIPALDAWRVCLERADTARAQFEEALWFALAHGDAHTTVDFHHRYRVRFPDGGDPQLEIAFAAQRDLAQRLLEAGPRLSLPLHALPSSTATGHAERSRRPLRSAS